MGMSQKSKVESQKSKGKGRGPSDGDLLLAAEERALLSILIQEHAAIRAYIDQAEVCPVCGGYWVGEAGEVKHRTFCPHVEAEEMIVV
jgi:hypothetical protein